MAARYHFLHCSTPVVDYGELARGVLGWTVCFVDPLIHRQLRVASFFGILMGLGGLIYRIKPAPIERATFPLVQAARKKQQQQQTFHEKIPQHDFCHTPKVVVYHAFPHPCSRGVDLSQHWACLCHPSYGRMTMIPCNVSPGRTTLTMGKRYV